MALLFCLLFPIILNLKANLTGRRPGSYLQPLNRTNFFSSLTTIHSSLFLLGQE